MEQTIQFNMRANSAYDRDGNSYRYHRHIRLTQELEERLRQEQKWTDIYKKAVDSDEKHIITDQK